MRKRRWHHLRHHILYKLTALLLNRQARPTSAKIHEILIGDDSETDADTYLLYARLVRHEVPTQELEDLLKRLEATAEEVSFLHALLERQDHSQVDRIYIHRTLKRPLEKLPPHERDLMIAATDSMQIAADAFLEGWFPAQIMREVANAFGPLTLIDSANDAHTRGIFTAEQFETINDALEGVDILYAPSQT